MGQWLKTQNLLNPIKPNTYDDIHTKAKSPQISIVSPSQDLIYTRSQKITVQVLNQSTYPLSKLDFYLNNTYIGSSKTRPFLFSFVPEEFKSLNQNNTLKVLATDLVFNKSESEINFTVAD